MSTPALSAPSAVLSPSKLADVVRVIAARPGNWRSRVRYDPGRRWYLRLGQHGTHEIWLLSWLPGQHTGFHDHGASAGAFAVASGSLLERAAPGGRPERHGRQLERGEVQAFGPGYVHDVTNTSCQPAVSLHAYSPSLTSMRRFEPGPGGLLRLTGVERSW